jgi:phage terminase large subunit
LTYTQAQIKARGLLQGKARNILLYGGSRSGKTFILVHALLVRASKAPGTRHLIVRHRFAHVKASIWYQTLPDVLKINGVRVQENKSDWFMTLPNGSEIWVGGLDDKERVEKILGNEYSTVYFNEVSQIGYDSITVGLTRLAEKSALVNRAY